MRRRNRGGKSRREKRAVTIKQRTERGEDQFKEMRIAMETKNNPKGKKAFKIGSLVFAKLKGHRHPHWPATVSHTATKSTAVIQKFEVLNQLQNSKSKVQSGKFIVKFFGTNQTSLVPASAMIAYNDNSIETFDTKKNRKDRHFTDALEQIFNKQLELGAKQKPAMRIKKCSVQLLKMESVMLSKALDISSSLSGVNSQELSVLLKENDPKSNPLDCSSPILPKDHPTPLDLNAAKNSQTQLDPLSISSFSPAKDCQAQLYPSNFSSSIPVVNPKTHLIHTHQNSSSSISVINHQTHLNRMNHSSIIPVVNDQIQLDPLDVSSFIPVNDDQERKPALSYYRNDFISKLKLNSFGGHSHETLTEKDKELWRKESDFSQVFSSVEENFSDSSSWIGESYSETSWVEPSLSETCDDNSSCRSLLKDNVNDGGKSDYHENDKIVREPTNSNDSDSGQSDALRIILNILTGLIGYVVEIIDDDFEAYCCDELFQAPQLEEHIKACHQNSIAHVKIKTSEWWPM